MEFLPNNWADIQPDIIYQTLADMLVSFSKMHYAKAVLTDPNTTVGTDAQLFVFFIMVVAAAEVSVGLAIIVLMYRKVHSVDINFLNRLKN